MDFTDYTANKRPTHTTGVVWTIMFSTRGKLQRKSNYSMN